MWRLIWDNLTQVTNVLLAFFSFCMLLLVRRSNRLHHEDIERVDRRFREEAERTEQRHREQMEKYEPRPFFFKLDWGLFKGVRGDVVACGYVGNAGRDILHLLELYFELKSESQEAEWRRVESQQDVLTLGGQLSAHGPEKSYHRLPALPYPVQSHQLLFFVARCDKVPKEPGQMRLIAEGIGTIRGQSPPWTIQDVRKG